MGYVMQGVEFKKETSQTSDNQRERILNSSRKMIAWLEQIATPEAQELQQIVASHTSECIIKITPRLNGYVMRGV